MPGQFFTVNSEHTLKCAQEFLARQWSERKWLRMELSFDKNRSSLQNASMHVYFGQLAEALNDAGYHYIITINQRETECNWDPEMVKRFIWKPIQNALFDKNSTTRLSTVQCQQVYEHVNRLTAEKFCIHIPWPSKDSMGERK